MTRAPTLYKTLNLLQALLTGGIVAAIRQARAGFR